MAQCLFKEIKRLHPEASIDVLAPAWCSAITQYMPEVNRLIEAPFKHGQLGLLSRWRLARQLAKQAYDIAYILPNSLKSALVPWFAGIARRVGFLGEQRYGLLNDHRPLDKQQLPAMVQRFVALAHPPGAVMEMAKIAVPELQVDKTASDDIFKQFSLSPWQSTLALCPGAEFGQAKQWPDRYYAAVARYYLDQGWQVCLLGSANDEAVCNSINAQANGKCVNLAGQTQLADAVAVLAGAQLVVSNDSGLMHIAAALHKPLVAVYGSTDPGFTPPLNEAAQVVRLGLDCSPCFKRECPLGHYNCLQELKPKQVLKACQDVLVGD